ncbi:unnamed protein product [Protopolystoma xenopodis]|uniref:26S proteasome non-ATPase regulatory subunit 8 n=1 Tax=Protopolystoma xenopodis TaxID=117903 RepID=A0A448WCV1_9PLAT|nr:unnamed protein product [Protopolystoma xenopodis]
MADRATTKMTQTSIDDVVRKFQNLTQEWNKKKHDLDLVEEKLKNLTLDLTNFQYLPSRDSQASRRELLIARDTLEIGASWSLEKKDILSFERYMSQLKCYYCDYKGNLPESPYKYELLGLNLLRLLAQGRLADFHKELERLSNDEINSNIYIKHPVSMEQYLMEGSFHKVFLSKGNVPSERYNFFIDILLNTTRDEISSCIEAAYERLELKEAARTLFFADVNSMKEYSKNKGWVLDESGFYTFVKNKKGLDNNQVPSSDVAKIMLEYTRELDQII